MKKLISKFYNIFKEYIYDPSLTLKDRSFMVYALIFVLSLIVTLMNGIITKDPPAALAATFAGGVIYIAYVVHDVRHMHIKRARIVSSILMCFLFMPVLFFQKGGIYSGMPVVMLVNGYFMILILEGKLQKILCSLNGMITVGCFLLAYLSPGLVKTQTREFDYFNILSLFILSAAELTIMVAFQTKLIQRETKFAQEKAREAEELNKSQNRFFSSMSHEIRTPINTVLGMNEIILRQEDASEEIKKDARNIQGAGKMLLALINDILDVSKIEAGKMDIVPVNYSVSALLSEIVNMIWLKAEEKGLKFNVDIDPDVPESLFGDEVRIKQILINLLNNAVKYTKEGSVSLHMECERPEDAGQVLLKINVSDTGMGIRQEALPHLFDTFQRQDEEKNRHIEGTGLGLSIVKQLVELMDGEITVNSVYGEGSVFAVSLKQGIASDKMVGDISVSHTGGMSGSERFEHSFHAPDARILIVDDNEMNLQVEKKLIEGTDMTVDLALSGAEALGLTLNHRYDVIFMDHLMPEMDGITCFEHIRTQNGGLNKSAPIIVLTANAGSENMELYNNTGFEGYLVKPVSGRQLEEMLIKWLPVEKVISSMTSEMTGASMNTSSGYSKKKPLIIATSSMSDIPEAVIKNLKISTVPYTVITDEGVFLDNMDLDSEELVRYMTGDHGLVTSEPPTEENLIKFFSDEIKKAHHLIYITLTSGSSREYKRAVNAAKSFDNVSVVNSKLLSSGTGILVMIAARLASQNLPVDRILSELEEAKEKIRCSFVIRDTYLMSRRGHISPFLSSLLSTLWLRPVLRMKEDKLGASSFLMGSERKCYEEYIKKELTVKTRQDRDFVFVTYAGMSEEDLLWIEDMVRQRGGFENIIFQKASAGIASNCGGGTFGLIYLEKGDRNYNLGSYLKYGIEDDANDGTQVQETEDAVMPDAEHETGAEDPLPASEIPAEESPAEESAEEESTEEKWYEKIPGIDSSSAVRNSGSAETFLSVLKIYYDSYGTKSAEIQGYYDSADWENYTIKVHALKSSSRLVGAMQLGNDAEALEMAGKDQDIDFIKEHHDGMMEEYKAIMDELAPAFGGAEDLPEIPGDMLADAYAGLAEFAESMDYELAKMVTDSLKEYKLPPEDEEKFKRINDLLSKLDWDGIRQAIREKN